LSGTIFLSQNIE